MKNTMSLMAIALMMVLSGFNKKSPTVFRTNNFEVAINSSGFITGMTSISTNTNYIPKGEQGALLAVVADGELKLPTAFKPTSGDQYTLKFEKTKLEVVVSVEAKKTHVKCEVVSTANDEGLEAVIWGPYPTTIAETIGENIGVVRNQDFAIGIQSLNPKTTAGKLDNIRGVVSYHGTAAEPADFGSILQAFAIDRTKDRTQSIWQGWENRFPGRPIDILKGEEGEISGTAIALFGVEPQQALATIGKIEVAEGLPHPEINGVWVKESRETNRAYAISPFTEDDVEQMIDYAKQAGLRALYHEGPFKTWGHFELDSTFFPSGRAGLKAAAQKVKAAGLNVGVHTLSNFITPNDKFVTPVPDTRLVTTGTAELTKAIGADDMDIEISSNAMILSQKNSKLNTVRIGKELVRYGSVSESAPYILYDCQRGAFGTQATPHSKGEKAERLLDFAYRIFYPNWEMQKDMVRNLTTLLNETGVNQMGFDGHEGCYATGNGDYAMDKFAQDWYDQLDHMVVNSSSRLKHYYWHINHFINWGEPWYGGFRESQADRRFKVQPFLERNYLKNMLGWFMITETTIPSDIEWMMARAAGYDAGFAMVLRKPQLEANPHTPELLALIRLWEEARIAGLFSDEQRERLKDGNNEFHLEKNADGQLVLNPYSTHSFEHQKKVLQPGEPTASEFVFSNRGDEQPLQFRLTVKSDQKKSDGFITQVDLEYDNSFRFTLPEKIEVGYSIVCNGTSKLRIYDAKGRFIENFDMGKKPPVLRKGRHDIRFDCQFNKDEDMTIHIITKQEGTAEEISL